MRLYLKIALWTVAILLVVGGISLYALYAFQRRAAIQQFELMARTLTTTILNSLETTMVHNNQGEIREIIGLIKREEMIRDVTIYTRSGAAWASTGTHTMVPERAEPSFHRALGERAPVTLEVRETGELIVFTPVANKPACQTCHAGDPPVLGVIGVSLWTVPVASQLRHTAQLLVVLVGFTILLALGTLNSLLGRFVLDPLSALVTTVRRVAGGQYQARAEVRRHDELGALATSINEMAERIEHYTAVLNTQIGDLTGRLASLGIFGRALTEASDLSAAMDEMTRGIRGVLRSDLAAIYLMQDGRLHLAHRSGSGPLPEDIQPGEGVIGAALARRRPAQSPDSDPTLTAPEGLKAVLAVPLFTKDRALGVLVAARAATWPFVEADASLLATLSNQLGTCMENVRLFQEVRVKEAHRGELLGRLISAHEDERRRIARELHDEVSQSLTSLMMSITAAQSIRDPETLQRRLSTTYSSAEATLEGVRKLIHDLRPTTLDDLGLVSAVRVHARNLLEASGTKLTFEAFGFGHRRLPTAVETTVFRVAQEAITNIARHAQAGAATVRLTRSDGLLSLLVEDNGVGFDPAQVTGRREDLRLGILGMQERAAIIGGDLRIDSQPGRGTRVLLTVAVEEAG